MIGILVHVWRKPRFEFEELIAGKSLDLAIRGNSFASEPNEDVTAPIWWRTPAGNTHQSRAVLSK